MDLKKLASKIATMAPALGTALAGPPGALVGGLVSSVASAFGLSPDASPNKIAEAIKTDPEAAVKLARIESDEKVKVQQINADMAIRMFQSETGRIESINTTMQAEAKSEHWPQYSWRPYWGFVSGTAFIVLIYYLCRTINTAIEVKNVALLNTVPLIISSFTGLFAIPGAICGVAAWGRNKLKINKLINKAKE